MQSPVFKGPTPLATGVSLLSSRGSWVIFDIDRLDNDAIDSLRRPATHAKDLSITIFCSHTFSFSASSLRPLHLISAVTPSSHPPVHTRRRMPLLVKAGPDELGYGRHTELSWEI